MRLIGLVESAGHVCCRYRLTAFRPYLAEAGHELELLPLPRRWWSWTSLRQKLHNADLVILQRKLLSPLRLHFLRRAARVLLFDFDDAVFLRDSYSWKGLQSARRVQAFAAMAETADLLVAGNAYLGEQASRWIPENRIRIIPTCVNPDLYPRARHVHAGEGVKLVWVGSSSTLQGLALIQPLLEELGRRCPGLRLKLICDRFLNLRHLPVLACPWSETTEAQAIAEADIGISWVPDDLWSRGKCGLKVLQYMAAGLPVVANPVGVQAEMVWHGQTGFLAETPAQWVEAVGRLSSDPALRRQMGEAGRRRVEAEFSVSVGAARWNRLLEEVSQRRDAA